MMSKEVKDIINRSRFLSLKIQEETNDQNADAHSYIKGTIAAWITTLCTYRAEPPIKGVVTQGKLRWRGITLQGTVVEKDKVVHYALLQRGKLLGKIEQRHTYDGKNTTISFRVLYTI